MPIEMMPLRKFTSAGLEIFESLISTHQQGQKAPEELFKNPQLSEEFVDGQLDAARIFETRYAFGQYLVSQLAPVGFDVLMAAESDAFWAWVAAVYFDQLSAATSRSKKPKDAPHFIVVRKGFRGSLHYRQGPRTCYEMVAVHGESARVCLSGPMGEFGDMAEQLTSRYNIARDVGYFRAACRLYLREGGLTYGASSRTRNPKKRKPNERRGMGGAGRLALALNRLSITFDTAEMTSDALLEVLPSEFNKFKSEEA